MHEQDVVALVQQWQAAANQQDIPRLLQMSSEQIELIGPRGMAQGHAALAAWVQRANVHLTALRTFAHHRRVVMVQHGVWRSPETGGVVGEADVATCFEVDQQQVVRVARYDTLDEALQTAQLTSADEL